MSGSRDQGQKSGDAGCSCQQWYGKKNRNFFIEDL